MHNYIKTNSFKRKSILPTLKPQIQNPIDETNIEKESKRMHQVPRIKTNQTPRIKTKAHHDSFIV